MFRPLFLAARWSSQRTVHALLALGLMVAAGCGDSISPIVSPPTPQLDVVTVSEPPQVAGSNWASCALRPDGLVGCWGNNAAGESPYEKAAAASYFVQVTMGAVHSCAVRADGVVECWGLSILGSAPATKNAASGVFVQVNAGREHTCALRNDGAVECWGNNGNGEAPALVTPTSSFFVQVTAGQYHSCALRSDGVVECWGSNGLDQAPASKTASGSKFKSISAGWDHTCGLRDDGIVECWGFDAHGQSPATKIAASGSFRSIESGTNHSCAIRSDGKVECWGTEQDGAAPALQTATASRFTQLGAGYNKTCGMRADHFVECWGRNSEGQATVPGAPSAPTGVSAVGGNNPDIYWTAAITTNWLRLFRRTEGETIWQLIDEHVSAELSTTSDPAAPPGVRYKYAVAACRFGGCTNRVATGYVTQDEIPPAPTGLGLSQPDPGIVTATWNAVAGATSYRIYRRERIGGVWTAWDEPDIIAAPTTNHSTGADAGHTYGFRVRACNAAGCGAYSTNKVITAT